MYIPKIRKKMNVVPELKELDKDTAITEWLIEKLIKTGELTAIKYGNALFINLDELFDFFTIKEKKNEKDDNR